MNSFFASSDGKVKWWVNGLIFAVVCYIIAVILIPLITKGGITQKELLIGNSCLDVWRTYFWLHHENILRKEKIVLKIKR